MDLKTYLSSLPRGGPASFAKRLDISPSYLSQLANGDAPVSPARAVQIEQASYGQVSRRECRPDDWHLIWPELKATA